MNQLPEIAVVLPAYDEELTIEATIRAFHDVLPDASIYVIDNRSKDRTAELAAKALVDLGAAGAVIPEPNPGKGAAMRRAFHEIDADYYVMADADLTYPAAEVHALLQPALDGRADMVVGDRMSEGHYLRENTRSLHNLGNNIIRWTINWLFHARLRDITSGYRVFTRQFVRNYPILARGFEIESDMTMHALHNGLRVAEVPITYVERPAGSSSKLRTFSDGARVLFTIAQIARFYRPLAFFSAFAALFVVSGLVAAIPVLEDWFRYQYIHHVPLAILATGLCITAMLCLGIGLVLDSVARNERLDFERRWMNSCNRRLSR